MSAVSDRIWITSKTRMISERRYQAYDLAAHLVINAASMTLLLTSIYPAEIGAIVPGLSKLNVASSLILFASTLLVYGFKFGEKAARYRECYLKLQEILDLGLSDREMGERYSAVLECYPNHADRDYYDLVVERHIKGGCAIRSPGSDKDVIPGMWAVASYAARRILFFSVCYVLPLAGLAVSVYALIG